MGHQVTSGRDVLGRTLNPDKEYKIKVYDFKRPDKFSKDQIRTISIMHDVFARLSTPVLSAHIRKEIKLHLVSVDQMTYEEFIQTIPDPSILGVVDMSPLPGAAVLQMDHKLFSALEDRLFGGAGKPEGHERDIITDIEGTLADQLLSMLMAPLTESWHQVVELTPEIRSIETRPQFCQIVPPTEMIVLVSIEAEIGDQHFEWINLAMPYIILEPILSRLTAKYYFRSPKRFSQRQPEVRIETRRLVSNMTLYVEGPELSAADLADIKTGDTLECPGLDMHEAWLCTGGQDVLKFAIDGDPTARSVSFSVSEGSSWFEERQNMIRELRTEATDSGSDAVVESLSSIAAELRNSVSEFKRGLKEIADRQDEMADQLFLSAAKNSTTGGRYEENKPFDFVSADDIEILHELLRVEHPQLSALVLSYLDPKYASRLISLFAPSEQIDLARRIVTIDRTHPEVLSEIDATLRRRFDLYDEKETLRHGGLESITSILSLTSRGVEKTIIEGLETTAGDIAEEIKKRMFVFEDIVLLNTKAVVKILKRAPFEDFATAMRGIEREVSDYIYSACDETMEADIRKFREEMGPMRLVDVEAAQMRIVEVIRRMEEEGEIIVARTDELVM